MRSTPGGAPSRRVTEIVSSRTNPHLGAFGGLQLVQASGGLQLASNVHQTILDDLERLKRERLALDAEAEDIQRSFHRQTHEYELRRREAEKDRLQLLKRTRTQEAYPLIVCRNQAMNTLWSLTA